MLTVLQFHIVGTDVLCDTARLTGNDIGIADVVEQRGLTVVHMAHDRHNRAARHNILFGYLLIGVNLLHHMRCHELGGIAELLCHEVDCFRVQTLVDAHHNTQCHAGTDDLGYRYIHHDGEVVCRNKLCEFQHLALRLLVGMRLRHLLTLLLAALAFVLAGRGLALLPLQALNGLFYLALYGFVVHLRLEALAFLLFVLGLLVTRIVDVHLVLFDALAFAFLALAALAACCRRADLALLLPRLTLLAFLLFGLLLGVRGLVDAAEVYLAHHFRRVLQHGLAQCEDFRLLFLGDLRLRFLFRLGRLRGGLGFRLGRLQGLLLPGLALGFGFRLCFCQCSGFGLRFLLRLFLLLTRLCFRLRLARSLFCLALVSIEVYLTHQLRLGHLGRDMLYRLGFDGYRLRYFTLLAKLCLTLCLQFKRHVLVKFFSKQQVQVILDTGIGIRSDFLTLLLTEFHGGGHADVQFFTSLDKFDCHFVNL